MDRPDPFYVVRDEIVRSLGQAKVEFEAWKHEVVSRSTNVKPVETALRETIRNIEWDIEDLQVIRTSFCDLYFILQPLCNCTSNQYKQC